MKTKLMKIFAVIGALAACTAVVALLIKKFGCKCKKCECCENDDPETVEDFVEEAAEKAENAAEAVEEKTEEVLEAAEDKTEQIAEEFKDYADVELPKQE